MAAHDRGSHGPFCTLPFPPRALRWMIW